MSQPAELSGTHYDLKRAFDDWRTAQTQHIGQLREQVAKCDLQLSQLVNERSAVARQARATTESLHNAEAELNRQVPALFETAKRLRDVEAAIDGRLRELRNLELLITREIVSNIPLVEAEESQRGWRIKDMS